MVTKQEIYPLFSFFALLLEAKLKITFSYLEMQTRQWLPSAWWPWARHQSCDKAELSSLESSNHRVKFGKMLSPMQQERLPPFLLPCLLWLDVWESWVSLRLLRVHSCTALEQQLLHVLVKISTLPLHLGAAWLKSNTSSSAAGPRQSVLLRRDTEFSPVA